MHNSGHDLQDGDRLYLVNERTGETLEKWRYDGAVSPEPKDWIRLYQRIASELAREPTMTVTAYRLWTEVIAKTGFGNAVEINLSSLARDFGCNRKSITNAARKLVELGVIERRNRTSYKLNPNYGWKGTHHWRERHADKWAAKEVASAEQHITVKDQG